MSDAFTDTSPWSPGQGASPDTPDAAAAAVRDGQIPARDEALMRSLSEGWESKLAEQAEAEAENSPGGWGHDGPAPGAERDPLEIRSTLGAYRMYGPSASTTDEDIAVAEGLNLLARHQGHQGLASRYLRGEINVLSLEQREALHRQLEALVKDRHYGPMFKRAVQRQDRRRAAMRAASR